MQVLQEHGIFKKGKYYLELDNKDLVIDKVVFHQMKGRYFQKKNYWVFPESVMDVPLKIPSDEQEKSVVEDETSSKKSTSTCSSKKSTSTSSSKKSTSTSSSKKSTTTSSSKKSESVTSSVSSTSLEKSSLSPVVLEKKGTTSNDFNSSYKINPPAFLLQSVSEYLV